VSDGENDFPITEIAPDLVGYKEVPPKNLVLGQQLGQVCMRLFCFFILFYFVEKKIAKLTRTPNKASLMIKRKSINNFGLSLKFLIRVDLELFTRER
jgi:hypothetical protein